MKNQGRETVNKRWELHGEADRETDTQTDRKMEKLKNIQREFLLWFSRLRTQHSVHEYSG